MWSISTDEDIDWEEYNVQVERLLEQFQDETGVIAELLGRSGRHVVVELNASNLLNYDHLSQVANRLEQSLIDNYKN